MSTKRHSIDVSKGYTNSEAQILMLHHLALAAAFFELLPELHIAPVFEDTPEDVAAAAWLATIKDEYKKLESKLT